MKNLIIFLLCIITSKGLIAQTDSTYEKVILMGFYSTHVALQQPFNTLLKSMGPDTVYLSKGRLFDTTTCYFVKEYGRLNDTMGNYVTITTGSPCACDTNFIFVPQFRNEEYYIAIRQTRELVFRNAEKILINKSKKIYLHK